MRSAYSAEMMGADCLPGAPGVPADPPVGVRHAVRHFQRHLPAGASSCLLSCLFHYLHVPSSSTVLLLELPVQCAYEARRTCMAYLNTFMSFCLTVSSGSFLASTSEWRPYKGTRGCVCVLPVSELLGPRACNDLPQCCACRARLTVVVLCQIPGDLVGGEFRIWDPAVHNSSIFDAPKVPEPTQRLHIKARTPLPCNLPPC